MREIQQFIERCRDGRPLREAIAFGEGAEFVRADAIDEPVEVLFQTGVRPGALRQFQQAVERLVEQQLGLREVPEAHFLLPAIEQALRLRDDVSDGVGLRRRGWCLRRGRRQFPDRGRSRHRAFDYAR